MSLEVLRRIHKGPTGQEFIETSAKQAFGKFTKESEYTRAGFEKWVRELELTGPGVEQLRIVAMHVPRLAGLAAQCSKLNFVIDGYEKSDEEYAVGLRLKGRRFEEPTILDGERRDVIIPINNIGGFEIYKRSNPEMDFTEPARYAYLKIGDALVRIPHTEEGAAYYLVNEIKELFLAKDLLEEKIKLTLELIRSIRTGIWDSDGKEKVGLIISEDVARALGFLHRKSREEFYDGTIEVRELEVRTRIKTEPTQDRPIDFRFVYNKLRVRYDTEIEDTSAQGTILVLSKHMHQSIDYMNAYFGEGMYSSCFFNERRFCRDMLWI